MFNKVATIAVMATASLAVAATAVPASADTTVHVLVGTISVVTDAVAIPSSPITTSSTTSTTATSIKCHNYLNGYVYADYSYGVLTATQTTWSAYSFCDTALSEAVTTSSLTISNDVAAYGYPGATSRCSGTSCYGATSDGNAFCSAPDQFCYGYYNLTATYSLEAPPTYQWSQSTGCGISGQWDTCRSSASTYVSTYYI